MRKVHSLAIAALLVAGLLQAQAPPATLTGRLAHDSHQPIVRADKRTVRVTADGVPLRLTLADERLDGREIRLEGRWKADGAFEAQRMFVVRGGSIFKLIYYCYTCSIVSYHPGICECCQEPTVPREVPNDANGYY